MQGCTHTPIVPPAHIQAGVTMSVLGGAGLLLYVAATWQQPGRAVMLVLGAVALATAAAFASPPVGRLLRSRWEPVLWLFWSNGLIAATAVGVAIDGGASSPLVPMFLLPLMFAGLSYPPWMAIPVVVFDVVACALALTVLTHAGVGYTLLVLSTLVSAGGLCVWQSRRIQAQHAELERLSRTDYLTGALNRRGFEERFAAALGRYEREDVPFTLLVFDLDRFKEVNDAHGHAAGDELLRWTAAALRAELRADDDLARLGGDEFAVLLSGCASDEAAAALERYGLRARQRTQLSGGAACCPADGTDAATLHRVADMRLYLDKRGAPERAHALA